MNFFGSKPVETGPSPLSVAKIETELYTDMFNKMSAMCFKKCIAKYTDPSLAVGEMTCVDRCVGKYLEGQDKVAEVLQTFENQMKAQQQLVKP